ncbi:hypothetical protein MIB92_06540 [Aestuariirhabdus sp. Z084]|uniref:hypothetical protein n=1 Tax=Aestuariirhabdus haliotis TaxID=2918751 RepID=UPI00201B4606|nr:hypothetical protein [Aestuariirhabdus haliotis]MCL6415301.1 hypothetical protein [Aestuariirhabdus haliotis]MCL6419561.1 hypothetical protein [Aestuariirhabdus haliotis]
MLQIRWLGYGLLTLLLLLALALLLLFIWPRPSFDMAPARDFGWRLPTLDQANYDYRVRDDGRLEIRLQHPVLEGVSPAMLSWWYQQLPIGRADWNGEKYSYYHLFHPSEHGVIRLLEPAADGSEGIGVGALVYRQERFGPFFSKGSGRILSFNQQGMLVAPSMGPLTFGRIEHRFVAENGGTSYSVHALLGSEVPIIGPIINRYIASKRFPPPVLQQWLRHQVEEVGTLPYFLPELYRRAHPVLEQKGVLDSESA